MSKIVKAIGGLSMVVGLAFAGATMANADRGDGQLACNYYEICFSEHSAGNGGQRHFYNGAEHSSAGNFHNGVRFYHNASAIRNRDSESWVCVEESGDWTNDRWGFAPRAASWANFAYDLNDENARHWRGGC